MTLALWNTEEAVLPEVEKFIETMLNYDRLSPLLLMVFVP